MRHACLYGVSGEAPLSGCPFEIVDKTQFISMVMRTEDILGYPVAAISPEACVDALVKGIDAATGGDAGEGAAGDGTAAKPC